MKPWTTLDRASAPGGGELMLQERDGEFVIRVDNSVLMSSRAFGSESAMAEVAFRERALAAGARVLVGGLGLGYTLRAVLDAVPASAQIVVVELSEAVVRWNRGPLASLANRPLEDARVKVEEGDLVAMLARGALGTFDALLFDIDNGPSALTAPENRRLYDAAGVANCRRALRPRGRLVVWSASSDRGYLTRLREGGFFAREEAVKARAGAAAKHILFIGDLR